MSSEFLNNISYCMSKDRFLEQTHVSPEFAAIAKVTTGVDNSGPRFLQQYKVGVELGVHHLIPENTGSLDVISILQKQVRRDIANLVYKDTRNAVHKLRYELYKHLPTGVPLEITKVFDEIFESME